MNWSASLERWSLLLTLLGTTIVLFELALLLRRRRLDGWRVRQMLANLSTLPLALVTAGVGVALWLPAFELAERVRPWSIPVTWWSVVVSMVVVDFAYYWEHRLEHRVAALWSLTHSVHHSSQVFDISVAYRISFVDNFTAVAFYLVPILLGLDTTLVFASLALSLGYQTWIHTDTIGTLGWFDRWFNSPANHRVHHGSDAQCLDKNYGSVLMVWDRMFGTYRGGNVRPVAYGLTAQLPSQSPWQVHFGEFVRLIRTARAANGERMQVIFGAPR